MTEMPSDAETLIRGLSAAHATGRSDVGISGWIPPDTDAAFAIQDKVAAAMGGIAGWKVGAATPTTPPLFAPILAGRVYRAGPAPIRVPARYAVETEIAMVMAKAFSASSTAPTEEEVVAAVGSAHVAIELCATRLSDWSKAPPLLNLADNQANYALVLGPQVRDWRAVDAVKQRAITTVAGKVVGDTVGGHSHKGLAVLLTRQVAHCVTRRGGMPAGTVITTGSWTGIHWLDAPAKVRGDFPGIGSIEIDLVV